MTQKVKLFIGILCLCLGSVSLGLFAFTLQGFIPVIIGVGFMAAWGTQRAKEKRLREAK